MLWRTASAGDFSTPERRAGLNAELKEMVREIAHPVVREYYKRHFGTQLQAAFPAPGRPAGFTPRPSHAGARPGGKLPWGPRMMPKLASQRGLGSGELGSSRPRERVLLAALVNHPALVRRVEEELAQTSFQDAELDALRQSLLDIAPLVENLDSAGLRAQLTGTAKQVAERLSAESTSMADKFVWAGTDLADAHTCWRDVWEQHMRAAAEIEHRWF